MPSATSLRTLLAGLVDYAGLFPPAQLPMSPAVQNYADYLRSTYRWALGRFIVPAARLDEFAAAFQEVPATAFDAAEPWRLSALLGDTEADLAGIQAFAAQSFADRPTPIIDTVELKAGTPSAIAAALAAIPDGITAYVELPLDGDLDALLAALAAGPVGGGRAKVRAGGVTPEQFPDPAALLRFIAACVRAAVPFKATAGLHHPVRAAHRLTYEPDSPSGVMFGFLNVFLVAAGLRAGMDDTRALALLTESDPDSLRWDDDGVAWRSERIDTATIASVRDGAAIAFGSCSFEEPIGDLRALGLLG